MTLALFAAMVVDTTAALLAFALSAAIVFGLAAGAYVVGVLLIEWLLG